MPVGVCYGWKDCPSCTVFSLEVPKVLLFLELDIVKCQIVLLTLNNLLCLCSW
jgi:hypothetical protein